MGDRPAPARLGQIRSDPPVHGLERQALSRDLAVQPDHMGAEAGLDRDGAELAFVHVEQKRLELRHRLPARDLAEPAAMPGRRAGRHRPGQGFESGRIFPYCPDGVFGRCRGLGVGFRVGRRGGEQDMCAFIDVGRAEPVAVVLVVASAGRDVGVGDADLPVEELACHCFMDALDMSVRVLQGLRRDALGNCLPEQELAHDQRFGRCPPGSVG